MCTDTWWRRFSRFEPGLPDLKTTLTAIAVALLPPGVVSSAEDVHWPGWLGPKRDGWVPYFEAR